VIATPPRHPGEAVTHSRVSRFVPSLDRRRKDADCRLPSRDERRILTLKVDESNCEAKPADYESLPSLYPLREAAAVFLQQKGSSAKTLSSEDPMRFLIAPPARRKSIVFPTWYCGPGKPFLRQYFYQPRLQVRRQNSANAGSSFDIAPVTGPARSTHQPSPVSPGTSILCIPAPSVSGSSKSAMGGVAE